MPRPRWPPEVLEAMLPYFDELYGNPSSMHSFGGQVGRRIREAREQVAALIGAQPDEIIFTSCGTESDNAAIRSALATQPGKRHIVTSRVEHPAVKALWAPSGRAGLPGDGTARGQRRPAGHGAVRRRASPRTRPSSASCGPTTKPGSSSRWRRRRSMARERGHPVPHRRGAGGRQDPDRLRENAIDMLSLSGHKLHAPKGVGVLYVRKGTKFSPFLIGRPPGEGPPGRHGKHPEHHRPGEGLRTGGRAPGGRKTPR